ncbi:hypothetical protein [Streptomyces noursei]|uniref:hypothetical protein n=1 Tax=Streptomyces noursei TaxID=1971 RepID=UPI0035DDB703
MSQQPTRTPIHEVAPTTDAEFSHLRDQAVANLLAPQNPVAEAVDKPDGELPPPEGDDEPKPWDMTPAELRAHVTTALWPKAENAHQWAPRPPMTLDQYLKDGI